MKIKKMIFFKYINLLFIIFILLFEKLIYKNYN